MTCPDLIHIREALASIIKVRQIEALEELYREFTSKAQLFDVTLDEVLQYRTNRVGPRDLLPQSTAILRVLRTRRPGAGACLDGFRRMSTRRNKGDFLIAAYRGRSTI